MPVNEILEQRCTVLSSGINQSEKQLFLHNRYFLTYKIIYMQIVLFIVHYKDSVIPL